MYIVLNCKIRIRVPYDSMSMGSPSVMYREWRIRFWGGESNKRQRAARLPTIHSSCITHRCRHTSSAYLCQSHTRVRTTWRVTGANISGLSGAQQLEFIRTIRIAFGIGREAGKRECEQVCCSWQVSHLVITESRWASEGFKSRLSCQQGWQVPANWLTSPCPRAFMTPCSSLLSTLVKALIGKLSWKQDLQELGRALNTEQQTDRWILIPTYAMYTNVIEALMSPCIFESLFTLAFWILNWEDGQRLHF